MMQPPFNRQATDPPPSVDLETLFDAIIASIGKVILGKEKQVRLSIACLLAGGHLLIEDIPGIGKTTLAKVLARSLGLKFRRVQFTSDMLPGDILGSSVFDRNTSAFTFHPGPVFTQVLLADEINRATPKTQSALLEAMEERQVTMDGKTRTLNPPFFVIATQNPMELSGTFPLPESQLDRFLMRIKLGYPDRRAENRLLKGDSKKIRIEEIKQSLKAKEVVALQNGISRVQASDAFLQYLQDILDFTRTAPYFHMGLSPRAGLALLQASKSWAFINSRTHTIPEDLQDIMNPVVRHRLRARENLDEFSESMLSDLLKKVPIP